jgi:monoamine oxidase
MTTEQAHTRLPPKITGLVNVGECMADDLRRAGDYAFAGGMSNLVEAVKEQAARLATYEAALREIVRYRDEVCVGTEGLVMSNIARKALGDAA